MDCASFHLLHPYETSSIDGTDRSLMQEYSYGDTLKSPQTLFFSVYIPDTFVVKLCRFHWPILTGWIENILNFKASSRIGQYVIKACEHSDSGKHSVAYKLKDSIANFSQSQVAAECMNHLAAGIDTTGDALCFLVYQLSKPESYHLQDQLIAEILSSKHKNIGELPYLEAVIKEGLRCFPPIPMSQPRCVPPPGRNIDGHYIPAGTIVSCQAWSVHRLNSYVFHNGNQFLPERWLDTRSIVDMNRLFFTFGAGGRSCTGRQ